MSELTLLSRSAFDIAVAGSESEIRACQKLRYRIFVEELGAQVDSNHPGLDHDRFDPYCKHVLVRDKRSNEIVATTRVLLSEDAERAGGFYSETEFEMAKVRALDGRLMEVGRTCIHANYRSGSALAMLWQGLSRLLVLEQADYLIGCASIPIAFGEAYLQSVLARLRARHFSPGELRVTPRTPLPPSAVRPFDDVILPPLLKGYLRQGALICGEPCWDPAFEVADVFVLLARDQLAKRYVRHFVQRV